MQIEQIHSAQRFALLSGQILNLTRDFLTRGLLSASNALRWSFCLRCSRDVVRRWCC